MSKSSARSRPRGAGRGRAKTARRIRRAMLYIQIAAGMVSAVAALIEAIRH
jgi:hypothetical protein